MKEILCINRIVARDEFLILSKTSLNKYMVLNQLLSVLRRLNMFSLKISQVVRYGIDIFKVGVY